MMAQQTHTESLFYYFRLGDQIPEDHLLRLTDRHIDFSFVPKQLKEFYSPTGRPSLRRRGAAIRFCMDAVHKQEHSHRT